MPRSRSIFIQSERVLRRSPLAFTWPARLMAPPNSNSFSVSVVLPASGCEMIAKVRRRATSVASGDAGSDSAVRAMSDMRERLAVKTLPIGTAYAVWTGIGAVGTAILGIILLGDPATALRLACIGLIVAGIVGLKLVT